MITFILTLNLKLILKPKLTPKLRPEVKPKLDQPQHLAIGHFSIRPVITILQDTTVGSILKEVPELPLTATIQEPPSTVIILAIEAARAKRAVTELPPVTTVERLVNETLLVIIEARVKPAPGQENNPSEPIIQTLQRHESLEATLEALFMIHLGLLDSRAKSAAWLNQCLRPHRHAYPAHRHFLKFKLGLNLPV